ncbi:Metalloenzyme, LuxS/M16 peptidase-like protein [Mycena floridula]|nr:Metalloenzyme, LuxS/M16 peptidase-like protein [Mycena floridula]
MLAARSSRRSAQRLARSFATVVESSGLKVAAVDTNQPSSSVTILVKAGSRYEPKPGVAHGLKNFAFKGTKVRSALGTIRESELYGGILTSSLSREYLSLTAEFLRGDEEFFVDVLTSFVTSAKYARHEFEEYVLPAIEIDIQASSVDPATRALDVAHALAFRSGLGSSLFATPHSAFTAEDIKAFAASAFTKDKIAVLGTGISNEALTKLVEKSLASLSASSSSAAPKATSYFGGETRLDGHGGPETVFIGFGSTGAASPDIAVLTAHLSSESSIKWSLGTSQIATSIPQGSSVQAVYLPYSDASLFGLLIQGQTPAQVTEAGKIAVTAMKAAAAGLKGDDLTKAIAKAKFTAATAVDGRQGLVSALGPQTFTSSAVTLDATLTSFDKVTAASFAKTASALIKVKPTTVVVGDVSALPHIDELGL